MSISLVAALAGTLAATGGTIAAVVRFARTPRVDLIAWAIATAGLTVALAAQVLGYRRGFAPTTFRAVQLGAQLVAPLALAWGIIEVAARSMPARFAGRLGLSALAVVAGVIMASDPLSTHAFGTIWPAASVHYQVLPNTLLKLLAAVAVLIALVAAIVAGVRGRNDHAWMMGFAAVGVAGLAILATEGLAVHLPANTGYPVLSVLAAALAVAAAMLAGRFSPAALRGASESGDDTGWGPSVPAGARGSGQSRGSGQYGADDSLGLYSGSGRGADDSLGLYSDSGQGGYPAPAGGYGDADGYPGFGGAGYDNPEAGYDGPVTGAFEGPVTGAFEGPVTGGFEGPVTGAFEGPVTGAFERPDPSVFERPPSEGFDGSDTGGFDGPVTGAFDPLYPPNGYGDKGDLTPRGVSGDSAGPDVVIPDSEAGAAGEYDIERLYGQIAIYTLLEHGAAEFDRLAERVVEQVRAHESGTLVYVVHGVPSAPLQRILYEVYSDRAAYDEHAQQSYIQEFEIGRRPLVLATNVIELGVRQAKVSPLGPQRGTSQSGTPPLGRPQLATPQSAPQPGPPPSRSPFTPPPQQGAAQGRPPLAPPPSGTPPMGRPVPGTPPSGRPYGAAPGGRARGDRPPGGRAL